MKNGYENNDREHFVVKRRKKLQEVLAKQRWQDIKIQTYSSWVSVMAEGKKIDTFLVNNNYRRVAIYGLGGLGRTLYEVLIESKCEIVCVVDNTYSTTHTTYGLVPCLKLSNLLPDIDIMIITAPEAEYEVKNYFKHADFKTKTLQEVLFVL
jgi:phosphoglycerate dehydrogenase-like enzyme